MPCLPPKGLRFEQGGVFWPTHTDDVYYLVDSDASSDHRLVWIDLTITSDTVEGDLDGDGDVDIDDIAVIRSHLRDDAAECQDCDIDGDGTITIRDARMAMSMCTLSRCARP